MRKLLLILAALLPGLIASVMAADAPRLTGPAPFPTETPAPPLPSDIADDRRVMRNYPDQPPVIPHSIRDYQIDRNSNKCLTCHSRSYTQGSQAPMISITHFMDRDGSILATVSNRRYFCTQCHVPQTTADPLVQNKFEDIDQILARQRSGGGK